MYFFNFLVIQRSSSLKGEIAYGSGGKPGGPWTKEEIDIVQKKVRLMLNQAGF